MHRSHAHRIPRKKQGKPSALRYPRRFAAYGETVTSCLPNPLPISAPAPTMPPTPSTASRTSITGRPPPPVIPIGFLSWSQQTANASVENPLGFTSVTWQEFSVTFNETYWVVVAHPDKPNTTTRAARRFIGPSFRTNSPSPLACVGQFQDDGSDICASKLISFFRDALGIVFAGARACR